MDVLIPPCSSAQGWQEGSGSFFSCVAFCEQEKSLSDLSWEDAVADAPDSEDPVLGKHFSLLSYSNRSGCCSLINGELITMLPSWHL